MAVVGQEPKERISDCSHIDAYNPRLPNVAVHCPLSLSITMPLFVRCPGQPPPFYVPRRALGHSSFRSAWSTFDSTSEHRRNRTTAHVNLKQSRRSRRFFVYLLQRPLPEVRANDILILQENFALHAFGLCNRAFFLDRLLVVVPACSRRAPLSMYNYTQSAHHDAPPTLELRTFNEQTEHLNRSISCHLLCS